MGATDAADAGGGAPSRSSTTARIDFRSAVVDRFPAAGSDPPFSGSGATAPPASAAGGSQPPPTAASIIDPPPAAVVRRPSAESDRSSSADAGVDAVGKDIRNLRSASISLSLSSVVVAAGGFPPAVDDDEDDDAAADPSSGSS